MYVIASCTLTQMRAKYTSGDEARRANPQMRGSQSSKRERRRCASAEPSGTPIAPANIPTRPNLYDTLSYRILC